MPDTNNELSHRNLNNINYVDIKFYVLETYICRLVKQECLEERRIIVESERKKKIGSNPFWVVNFLLNEIYEGLVMTNSRQSYVKYEARDIILHCKLNKEAI